MYRHSNHYMNIIHHSINRQEVLIFIIQKCELYQEEEHVIVVGAVHAESSVYMAQVMVVIQLGKGLIWQLRFAMETLKQVIACEEWQNQLF